MSTGVVHNAVSVAAAATCFSIALSSGLSVETATLLGVGCLAGIILTPDLDQQTYNRVENKWRKSKNPFVAILGQLYIIFWYPYALMIPHRSWVSHMPIVGTVLRILYILVFSSIILLVVGVVYQGALDAIPPLWLLIPNNFERMAPFFYGLAISDALHWFFDTKFVKFFTRSFGL